MIINKKHLFYLLLVLSLFILLNLFKIQKVLATDAVVQTIRNGDVLDATPVNNNDQNLASVINGKLDSNNITDGSLKAIDLENNINLNSKLLTGSIGFDKASTDWFNANYPVYKNTGLNAIDLRISSRLLNSAGTLDLSGNAITGYYLSNTLFDTGLSFNQPDSKVYVKVDAAYNTYDVADSIYGTITFNDTKQLTLQASVSLDGGTTYLQPNIAISASASDSLQTTNKTSLVSAINSLIGISGFVSGIYFQDLHIKKDITIDGTNRLSLYCKTFTLDTGITITGNIIIIAEDSITINGTINASGYGATGGLSGLENPAQTGKPGSPSFYSLGSGGAGQPKSYAGGSGGDTQTGFNTIGGSGGGGAGKGTYNSGGTGGNGGGFIVLQSKQIVLNIGSYLMANGTNGIRSDIDNIYGGGGGGGLILLSYSQSLINNGTLEVNGGTGYQNGTSGKKQSLNLSTGVSTDL